MASEGEVHSHYDGSRQFLWLSEIIKLPIDQVNFIFSQVSCLVLALVLRYVLHPRYAGAGVRHLFSIASGLLIIFFCHGRDSFHLAILSIICYLILKYASPKFYHTLVLGVAMSYLSIVQLLRIRNCYGCFVLDITGPLMLLTQKVSSLAFSLHDGFARDEKELTPEQKKLVIRGFPSIVEYFSYIFHFQTILCGPLTFYPDYISFIEGRHYRQFIDESGLTLFDDPELVEPPYLSTVLKKLLGAFTFGVFFVTIGPWYTVQRLRDDEFVLQTSFLHKMWLLIMVTTVARFKYYHAWLAADAISNACGLGFNGYDVQARPKWNLISNVHIPKFEFAASFRGSMENWNKGTMRWLRYVVYERSPTQKTITTYLLSALWHGFYPGYYLCFGTAALVTIAARNVRRCFRYRFQNSLHKYMLYEFITFLVTKVAVAYIVFPFLLLELQASFRLYRHLYFYLHILCLFSIFFLPRIFTTERANQAERAKLDAKDKSSNKSSRRLATVEHDLVSDHVFVHSVTNNGGSSVVVNGKDKVL